MTTDIRDCPPDAKVGLFTNHPRVWHLLVGQEVGSRITFCGLWPDTFANYMAVRLALPMCKRCEGRPRAAKAGVL